MTSHLTKRITMKITTKRLKTALANFLMDSGVSVARAKDIVERSIFEGNWNGWAEGAMFTISGEDGLPGYMDSNYEKFEEIVNRFEDAYIEAVNGGVNAIYKF